MTGCRRWKPSTVPTTPTGRTLPGRSASSLTRAPSTPPPRRTTSAVTTTRKKIRTKRAPRAMATRAPAYPPMMFAAAIISASCHITAPCGMKTTSAARLVAQLASLALAEAWRKS